eukprot:6193553-Pleurochrysis_carterae.AAC.1
MTDEKAHCEIVCACSAAARASVHIEEEADSGASGCAPIGTCVAAAAAPRVRTTDCCRFTKADCCARLSASESPLSRLPAEAARDPSAAQELCKRVMLDFASGRFARGTLAARLRDARLGLDAACSIRRVRTVRELSLRSAAAGISAVHFRNLHWLARAGRGGLSPACRCTRLDNTKAAGEPAEFAT